MAEKASERFDSSSLYMTDFDEGTWFECGCWVQGDVTSVYCRTHFRQAARRCDKNVITDFYYDKNEMWMAIRQFGVKLHIEEGQGWIGSNASEEEGILGDQDHGPGKE